MELLERAQVAARPGRVWRVVTERGGGGGDAARPRQLTWVSREVLDGEPVDVHWTFRAAPSWNGTEIELCARVAGAGGGAERVRRPLGRRLVEVVRDIKSHAELEH